MEQSQLNQRLLDNLTRLHDEIKHESMSLSWEEDLVESQRMVFEIKPNDRTNTKRIGEELSGTHV